MMVRGLMAVAGLVVVAGVSFAVVRLVDDDGGGSPAAASLVGALVVRADGTVVAVGEVPEGPPPAPAAATGVVDADGGVRQLWFLLDDGSVVGSPAAAPALSGGLDDPVGLASREGDQPALWAVDRAGTVRVAGAAAHLGDLAGTPLAAPIVDVEVSPSGGGYWLVGADGGVFAFGDAGFFGSLVGRPLAAPIVDAVVSPSGGGYWLVGADGGVFAFGEVPFPGAAPPGGAPAVAAVGVAG